MKVFFASLATGASLFLLVVGVIVVSDVVQKKTRRATVSAAFIDPPPQSLGAPNYEIAPGRFGAIQFYVGKPSQVYGDFETERFRQGDDNTEVYLLRGDEVGSFTDAHQFPYIYFSGRVGSGHFDELVQPGTYAIILNNRFSLFATKRIHTRFFVK